MKKTFAVFGLGRFGGTMVKELSDMHIDVIAIDKDEDKVNEYVDCATYAHCADAIDESYLKEIGVRNVDHAFVSFGNDLEASILTSLILKELGVPKVWAKAKNEEHAKVLNKIGVDKVIHPERDVARKITKHITSDKMIDFIELSDTYSMVEIIATKKIKNKTIKKLDLRSKYGCTIIGIQREEDFIISPLLDEVIHEGDTLVIVGKNEEIKRFEKYGV
ncbi:potassium channel family protein [Salinicoccus halodurans]|uniref:Potassium transporter Trk n=1 Tax=Salinicoccus halodurans TaxID=407035 RepID=A0A0F7HPY1_9STAP|nr:TrkA family potassium uptake protein [Salinicoccus halodurans]AKG75313.1 potassium transporter Trk [Salinicoccus halodurans]SFK93722.1 trk system potassium uptake protein TrkA [Salinicoccus halodurans]